MVSNDSYLKSEKIRWIQGQTIWLSAATSRRFKGYRRMLYEDELEIVDVSAYV